MDFGKLTSIEGIQFALPAAHPRTTHVLAQGKKQPLQVFVGCPVWACKEWQGHLYPQNTPEKQFLQHYTRQFNTIELNTTHYRTPDDLTIQRWYKEAGNGFKFCPKLLQAITHEHQLTGNTADQLTTNFLTQVAGLQDKLGLVFMQLPPYFSPSEVSKLQSFLEKHFQLPSQGRQPLPFAIEFRHEGWFRQSQAFEKVCQLLETYQIATVLCDVAGRRDVLHQRLTTPDLVLRFVGNGLHPTDYSRTDEWIQQLKKWVAEGLQNAYLFIHEPDNTKAPEMAAYWLTQLNQHLGLNLKMPYFYGSKKGVDTLF